MEHKRPDISIVVPCYNEEESLPLFLRELERVAEQVRQTDDLTFEVVLIDDGSTDGTLATMKREAQRLPAHFTVRWASFSRNFGKEAALYAGLSHATGELVATMDADMQDPPSLLPEMYRIITTEDVDNVATRRTTREGEPPIRSLFARMFYKLINKISKADIVDGARDFRLMKRPMVDAILSMREYNRFSKGIYGWVGFKTRWLPYVNVNRVAGETKWSFFSLLLYSIDGIVAFSTVPLSIASVMGTLFCIVAFFALIFIVVRALLFGDPVDGWPSLASIIIFIGGVQLLCLGIMGQYLAKTYLETKNRPLYIVRESNLDE
ncbi:MAG: glycosyltransferase family 2 protein [Collinsella stercoris]|uniref:glycosyltransferase family 2 protein n=1 Tax=Collinsella stercoris TaxID=147206 RepID=UPI003995BE81